MLLKVFLMKKEYKSIIWLRLDSIGDAVLSSSMLPHIKAKYPEAKITVVCQRHVAELYEHCPFVDDIITTPTEANCSIFQNGSQHLEVLTKIKDKCPDLLLNSVYSVHYLSDMNDLEFIPERFAFRNVEIANYTNIISLTNPELLELNKHLKFLESLDIKTNSLEPQIWLTEEDKKFALGIFQKFNLSPEKVIVLFAGARVIEKTYDQCGESVKRVCEEFGYKVITVGTKEEYAMNQKSLDVIGEGINLSGELTIRQTAAIIEQCRMTVGPDTGFSHVACAVQTPNVVILGGGYKNRFFPYSNLTSVISIPMDCWGCNYQCKGRELNCLRLISPDMVEKGIRKVLGI